MAACPLLFTATEPRGVKLENPIVISSLRDDAAVGNNVSDLHMVNWFKFGPSLAGLACTESAAATDAGQHSRGLGTAYPRVGAPTKRMYTS